MGVRTLWCAVGDSRYSGGPAEYDSTQSLAGFAHEPTPEVDQLRIPLGQPVVKNPGGHDSES